MDRVFGVFFRRAGSFKVLALLAVVAVCGVQPGEVQAVPRISALEGDACAISTQGGLQCWGNNAAYGGADVGRATDIVGFPADLVGLVGSTQALCALSASSALWCQGHRPGNGATHSVTPVMPIGMESGVIDVARGPQLTCVAKADGSVWCWGYNYYGMGDGETFNADAPIQILPASFQAAGVAVGVYHMCAWSQSGEGRCWGYNQHGQLGHGVWGDSEPLPVVVAGLSGIQSMATFLSHTCALISGGEVYCWGSNDYRQLGDGTYTNSATPVLSTQFSGNANQAVSAGDSFTCVQTVSGEIACEGADFYRQTAAAGVLNADAGQVALYGDMGCALVDGRAHCWGRNDFGQTGNGRFGNEYAPARLLGAGFAQAPSTVREMGCAARQDGGVSCWGGSMFPPPYAHVSVAGIGGSAAFVGNGERYQCVLRDDAKVLCWGDNWLGMIGDGTTEFRASPTPLVGVTQDVRQLSVGLFHNCALLADTSVVCWGANGDGRAGGVDFEDRPVPGPVDGLPGIVQVSAGYIASCAVDGMGQVWCWGSHMYGHLGLDTAEPSAVPVQIQGLPAAAQQVAVGQMHACALLVDGRIACWGVGTRGQLGHGAFESFPVAPVVVASTESFVQVVSGAFHTCARNSANDVFCWGGAQRGQLGAGVEIRSMGWRVATPQAVAIKALDLSATTYADSTCALDAQADAWCWGANEFAQLGIGRRGVREVPGPVMGMGEDIFSNGFEP